MTHYLPYPLDQIIEAALMASDTPLTAVKLQQMFANNPEIPSIEEITQAIDQLKQHYHQRSIELVEVASGWQLQTKTCFSQWISKLFADKPQKYSRAFMETLAIIAYRQPITRAEVEAIRGISGNSTIFKTLLEREWIKIMGYKELPGKPPMYGTTKYFLNHFNLKNLQELPNILPTKQELAT